MKYYEDLKRLGLTTSNLTLRKKKLNKNILLVTKTKSTC